MLSYIFFTLVSCVLCSILHFSNKQTVNNVTLAVLFMLLCFFAGLRNFVGIDYIAYYNFYTVNLDLKVEPVYYFIRNLFKLIGLPIPVFFLFFSSLTVYFSFKAIKAYSLNIALSILLFILLGFYTGSMNLLRQFVAVPLYLLYGYRFIKEGSLWKYFVAVLLISLFHYSLLIMLPVYFFVRRDYSKNYVVSMVVLAIAVNIVLQTSSIDKLHFNFSKMDEHLWFSVLNNIDKLMLLILLQTNKQRLIKLNATNQYLINFYILFTCLSFATIGFVVLKRFALYSEFFSLLTIPVLLSLIERKQKRLLATMLVVLYYFAWFYYFILLKNEGQIIPYKSIFL